MKNFLLTAKWCFCLLSITLLLQVETIQAQWQQCNGPFGGGVVNKITSRDSLIYACTDAGLYISVKNSNAWSRVYGLPYRAILDIDFDGSNIYIGTAGKKTYKSNDNGLTWNPSNSGISDTTVTSVKVMDTLVFAGTKHSGLFVSNNEGLTWTHVAGVSGSNVVSMASSGSLIVVAMFGIGVFVSVDGGINWTHSNTGMSSNLNFSSIASNGTHVLVTRNYSAPLLSSDSCLTWTDLSAAGTNSCGAYIKDSVFYVCMIDGPIKKSLDNGVTWISSNNGITPKLTTRTLYETDSILYAGTDGAGVYQSANNGVSWSNNFNGMRGNITCVLSTGNNIYAGTRGDGLFWSSDSGLFWNRVTIGLNNSFINDLAMVGTTIFAATDSGLFKSTNYGITWNAVAALGNKTVRFLATDDTVIYVANKVQPFIQFSSNLGLSWFSCNTATWPAGCLSLSVTNSYMITSISGVGSYYSLNYGGQWTQITSPGVGIIVSSCFSNNSVYAGGYSEVWRSNLYGGNWYSLSTGLPSTLVVSCLYKPNGNKIYSGSDYGIYTTTNNGLNWYNENTGIDYLKINKISDNSVNVYLATTNGVWQRDISTSIAEITPIDHSQKFKVYPNPSNGVVNFEFMDAPQSATVEIVNIYGQKVYEEKLQHTNKGSIDISNLTKGIYLIKYNSNRDSEVQKIIMN